MKQIRFKSKRKIDKVDVTEDTLTGRGGMALFVRYASKVNIYALLLDSFGNLRRSKKGQPMLSVPGAARLPQCPGRSSIYLHKDQRATNQYLPRWKPLTEN